MEGGQPQNSSNNSNIMINATNTGSGSNPQLQENATLLPMSAISRLMREVVPANAKISEEAKEMIRLFVTEFIGFVTKKANERSHNSQRRTLTTDDLLWAMSSLGFANYSEIAGQYLRRVQGDAAAAAAADDDGQGGFGSSSGGPNPA